MIKHSIELLANNIGLDIGASNNIVQSDLLNGFCKGLHNSILNKNDLNLQLFYIVEKLDTNAHFIIKELAEYIKLKEQNK